MNHSDEDLLSQHLSPRAIADVLRTMAVGVVVAAAPSGRLVHVNAAAERMLGGPPAPGDLPLERAIRDGEGVSGEELRLRRADGTWVTLAVDTVLLRDEAGVVTACVATFSDITARAEAQDKLRRAEARLQGLIDTVDGIVWEVDLATFCFTFVSRQAERLLGYRAEEWYRPDFWADIIVPDDREWAVAFCLERTAKHEAHDFEYRVRAKDGRTVWLRDIVSVVVEDGRPVALRGIMVDVSTRKAAEEATQHALRLREEFLIVASHELRTPLTTLRLSVESLLLLAGSNKTLAAEALQGSLQRVLRGTERLEYLTGELLDVTRIAKGNLELHPTPTDLATLVRGVVADFELELGSAGCTVSLTTEAGALTGTWDAAQITRVVTNLLTNAIKFGRGRPIEVAVAHADGSAQLTVRDHGIGIDPARMPFVFERFERAVRSTNYGGLGLGLFIARSIVQAHGGTISVASEEGAGSTFTVRLPLAA